MKTIAYTAPAQLRAARPAKRARPAHLMVQLCVPDDQAQHLPLPAAPRYLPLRAPLPRQGDVVFLAPRSAWCVEVVIFDMQSTDEVRVEVWLTHVASRPQHAPDAKGLPVH